MPNACTRAAAAAEYILLGAPPRPSLLLLPTSIPVLQSPPSSPAPPLPSPCASYAHLESLVVPRDFLSPPNTFSAFSSRPKVALLSLLAVQKGTCIRSGSRLLCLACVCDEGNSCMVLYGDGKLTCHFLFSIRLTPLSLDSSLDDRCPSVLSLTTSLFHSSTFLYAQSTLSCGLLAQRFSCSRLWPLPSTWRPVRQAMG